MKARVVAITLGAILAAAILATAVYTHFRIARPSRVDVRGYFESVPTTLGWRIHSQSDWNRGWRESMNELPAKERMLDYITFAFTGFPQDTDSCSFETQSDYVDVHIFSSHDSVDQIRIYGGWTPNPDTLVLQEDMRRKFPNLKIDVLPWSSGR